jgi:2-keto-4-pentenoate hydratase
MGSGFAAGRCKVTNAWDDPRIQRGMHAQLAKRRARTAAGEKPLGWKVGFGAPAMMEKLKIAAPLVGFLMQRALVPSGGSASLHGWVRPVLEPEIAVHIGRDLPGGGDPAAAAAAIAALAPAIELADADLPFEDPEAILKGNIFQRHVILGERDASRAGGSTAGLTARVFRRDAEVARTSDPEAATGKLVDIVRHVADLLAAFGERLSAGDIIIAGSVLPPIAVEADEASVAYALDPIGRISVAFTR